MTLATAASYESWLADSMSEASLLVTWGGILLTTARGVRATNPAVGPPKEPEARYATEVGLEASA